MFSRLQRRWAAIRSFAAGGQTLPDRCALAVAGFARHRPFGDQSLYARVGRRLFRDVTPRITAAAGQRLRLDLTDLVDSMIYQEIFIDGIYPLQRVPFTPDLVADCGACHGMFSLLARAHFPSARLVAFEPEPANFARLQANLALNPPGIEAHRAAVGAVAGRISFCGSGFGGHVVADGTPGSIEVEVRSLPELVRQAAPARLLLKIDIEGAEQELLPALLPSLPRCCAIFLETHHEKAVCDGYLQPYLSAGFKHGLIRHRLASPDDVGDYAERFLVR